MKKPVCQSSAAPTPLGATPPDSLGGNLLEFLQLRSSDRRVHIPTKSAADSERMRPPLGAERRTLSNVTQLWPTSGFIASRLRIDSPFKVIL